MTTLSTIEDEFRRADAPQQVSIEQLTATNADLAAQVSVQTNVCAYFKKVHADAVAALRERERMLGLVTKELETEMARVDALRSRVAELEARLDQRASPCC